MMLTPPISLYALNKRFMKSRFSLFSLLVCLLSLCWSCVDSHESAYPQKKELQFTAEGGQEKVAFNSTRTDKLVNKKVDWNFHGVYLYTNKGTQEELTMGGYTPLKLKEEMLSDGSYKVDAGWVKFYYPNTKHMMRVEVEPNPTDQPRKVYFYADWYENGFSLGITQSGKLQT